MFRISSSSSFAYFLTDHLLTRFYILTFIRHSSLIFTHIHTRRQAHGSENKSNLYAAALLVHSWRKKPEEEFQAKRKKSWEDKEFEFMRVRGYEWCCTSIYRERDRRNINIHEEKKKKKKESEKNLYKWSFKKHKKNMHKVWEVRCRCSDLIYTSEGACSILFASQFYSLKW